MKNDILAQYKGKESLLESFKTIIENLIKQLISHKNYRIHQIISRLKDYESLSLKIDKKLDKYKAIDDITDIVGIRIITYLESDVDNIEKLIMSEFQLDSVNSIDKRKLRTDQFGYKSLHIVVSINEGRCQLPEYKPYTNFKCEIQIRSILQHAWAEIEHNLGYKNEISVPDEYLRSFNRLAALLETADIEFDRLKKELHNYESKVADLIQETPEEVTINKASMDSFITTTPVFKEAQQIIEENTGATLSGEINYDGILERFTFFKIISIKDLEELLVNNKQAYLAFVNEFTKEMKAERLPSVTPLYYLQHYLASKTEDPQTVLDYFSFSLPQIDPSGDPGNKFVEIYRRSKNVTNK